MTPDEKRAYMLQYRRVNRDRLRQAAREYYAGKRSRGWTAPVVADHMDEIPPPVFNSGVPQQLHQAFWCGLSPSQGGDATQVP
jgi:hypothetical protein